MSLQSRLEEGERRFARIWKVTALYGMSAIAFGIVVLVWPGLGLTALIALFAAFALAVGVVTIVGALRVPLSRSTRAWLVLDGLLAIAVGVVVVVWPDLSAHALLYAIAAWAIATGVLGFVGGAIALPLSGGRSLLLMLWGVISVAFGAIMFARPGAGALALLTLIAAFAIVGGVLQVGYALELRRIAVEFERRLRPKETRKPVVHGLHAKGT